MDTGVNKTKQASKINSIICKHRAQPGNTQIPNLPRKLSWDLGPPVHAHDRSCQYIRKSTPNRRSKHWTYRVFMSFIKYVKAYAAGQKAVRKKYENREVLDVRQCTYTYLSNIYSRSRHRVT
eukprot:g48972.t1